MDRIVNSSIIIKTVPIQQAGTCNGGSETGQIDHTIGSLKMHKTIYFLKRLGVLHNISISFQPYDERRSCNVVETDFLANYTVFVSLALMPRT